MAVTHKLNRNQNGEPTRPAHFLNRTTHKAIDIINTAVINKIVENVYVLQMVTRNVFNKIFLDTQNLNASTTASFSIAQAQISIGLIRAIAITTAATEIDVSIPITPKDEIP